MHASLAASAPAAAVLAAAFLAPFATAQSSPERPEPYVLRDVRLSDAEDAPRVNLLLRAGRIDSIEDVGAEVPPGMRSIDGAGHLAVPAFVDAFSRAGIEVPETLEFQVEKDRPADVRANVLTDMREANRKGVHASFRAVDVLDLGEEGPEKHRENGFAALLAAPGGELLSGSSCLATTRDAALRDAVVAGEAFQHATFAASGQGYPSTLMGYHAQLRQLFLDAQRHAELEARHDAGRPGRRPAWDADLAAARRLLAGEVRLVCEAQSSADIERWLDLADEFGFEVIIAGGREAWRIADRLAAGGVPVILTLDWGDEVDDPHEKDKKKGKKKGKQDKDDEEGSTDPESDPDGDPDGDPESEPDDEGSSVPEEDDEAASETDSEEGDADGDEEAIDWEYESPLGVREEQRRLWVETRDCALRLAEAGVVFSLGTGADSPSDLLERARELVEAGLSRDLALSALTAEPARLLGVQRHFGNLEPGQSAAIALWTAHPMDEDAKLACLVVDGFPYEFEVEDAPAGGAPDEGVDVTGTWNVSADAEQGGESTLILEMAEDGSVSGKLEFESPMDQSQVSEEVEGQVSGTSVSLKAKISMGDFSFEISLEGEVDGDTIEGTRSVKFPGGEQSSSFEATRDPQGSETRN